MRWIQTSYVSLCDFSFVFLLFQGYDDGYDGEYDDESYEGYDDNYSNQSKRCTFHFFKDILSQHELINAYFHSKKLSKCLIRNIFSPTVSQNIMNMDMAIMMKPIIIMVRKLSDLQFC